jgi:hypothetical protein
LQILQEFLLILEQLEGIILQQGIPDKHLWRLSNSGQYTAKSAYDAFFLGLTLFGAADLVWKGWATPKCSFFMWLVAHNRCWTADQLAKRNLPHPTLCVLCDQEKETINHLLAGCVFARQFWFYFLQRLGLSVLSPQPGSESLEWWLQAVSVTDKALKWGLNSLIILGAWILWKHRNDIIFNGATPHLSTALSNAGEEAWCWSKAGVKGLQLQLVQDVEDVGFLP